MAVDSGGKATGAKIGTIFEAVDSCYGHCSLCTVPKHFIKRQQTTRSASKSQRVTATR